MSWLVVPTAMMVAALISAKPKASATRFFMIKRDATILTLARHGVKRLRVGIRRIDILVAHDIIRTLVLFARRREYGRRTDQSTTYRPDPTRTRR